MIDIFLNSNTGDIDLTNNTMRLTNNIQESSRQQVLISLQTFQGEWIFNIDAGVPWIANENNPIQLLGVGSKEIADLAIKEDILGRENITRLQSYSSTLNRATGQMTVSFEAVTNSGEVVTVTDQTLT